MQFEPCNLPNVINMGLEKLKFDKIVPLYKTMTIGSRLDCVCQVMDTLGKLKSTQKPRVGRGYMTLTLALCLAFSH